jgi:hypothetical protein
MFENVKKCASHYFLFFQRQGPSRRRQRPDREPEEAGRHREGVGDVEQGHQRPHARQRNAIRGPLQEQVTIRMAKI